uniref:Nudix hydrolase domain-containing protein n=1 Tax=Jaculus jaculus TaxID=51337 RepID=A0A8C5LFS9_JACJA
MEHVDRVAVSRCVRSLYLRPLTLQYRQNGVQNVTILMFNSSQKSLVLVKQFRPGEVEYHFPGSLTAVDEDQPQNLQQALPGLFCAGIVDQPWLSLKEVACKEAWEECGGLAGSVVGLTGSRQTMFYTEVTDEGQLIEVVHLPLDEAQPLISKILGIIFAVSWFFSQVAPSVHLQ